MRTDGDPHPVTRGPSSVPEGGTGAGGDADGVAQDRALALAASVRGRTSPNPWVGCVILAGATRFEGATEPPGGPHAEAVALAAAGASARGATLVTTLEPCAHQGRTPPCARAIAEAGVARVVVAVRDPDPQVAGRGMALLRERGVEVVEGVRAAEATELLAPYLTHRRTGRPWVVLKLAATLDGRIAAPDGSSQWITGDEARADAMALRARSDAVLVGAGTVRADDPQLTVRGQAPPPGGQPLRVVLGQVPDGARVLPALERTGDPAAVLDELGGKGVLQVLVEGGAQVARQFHEAGLVDRYVLYLAPALFGGDDGRPLFAGPGVPSMAELWRGRIVSVARLGPDLRVELAPRRRSNGAGGEG
ncbi:MAG: bifunctional diaminohydroxyphosphoribosylaminopyrimidine deaminase/5-amino-6-(5-phosphoribosylamino)uracil reductase RibD [Acidobacteriota bacterium]|nr:bifunctional diaminohydroxyphosphoribosylaminopyrimidine deaminase/5-amino-6-(5-phosphoribosylamino)uracil reductase RibD [Acidobacteriota bacterium]